MKKTVYIVAALLVLIGVAYVVAQEKFPSGTWRYKMTVSVETPEGLKTGSAVREVTVRMEPRVLGLAANPHAYVKGEAVAADLGTRGVLFALLGTDYGATVFTDAFMQGWTTESILAAKKTLKPGQSAVLKPGQYPQFVRFKDLKNPTTVENVLDMESDGRYPIHYTIKTDHTEELFGAGVKIKEVKIEVADESVTWEIEKKLPWLTLRIEDPTEYPGYIGGGGISGNDPTKTYLTGIEFTRGRK